MEISYRLDFPREKARDGRPAEVFRRLPLPVSHEVNKIGLSRPHVSQGEASHGEYRTSLRAPSLSQEQRDYLLAEAALHSLADLLEVVPDPRGRHGLRYDLPFLLTCLTAALLCNYDSTEAVAQWCQDQRGLLRRMVGARLFLTPSGSLYRWLLPHLDASVIERVLGAWVQATTKTALVCAPATPHRFWRPAAISPLPSSIATAPATSRPRDAILPPVLSKLWLCSFLLKGACNNSQTLFHIWHRSRSTLQMEKRWCANPVRSAREDGERDASG